MANVFENIGTFDLTRLRSQDVPYLSGAVSSRGEKPIPVALARGPQVLGPGSAVGISEWWSVGVAIPATPEVAWVMVNGDYTMKSTALIPIPNRSFLFAFGDVANVDNFRGPVLGIGTEVATAVADSGGDFTTINVPEKPRPKSLWIPLDPADTSAGWTVVITTLMGATATAADDISIDMSQVLFLGYPVNAWNNGDLWSGAAYRGS